MERTIKNTTKVRDVIQSLHDTGLAKKIDLDRTTVALNNLKSAYQQLSNALNLQENALKYLIGMDINQEISLPDITFEVRNNILRSEEHTSELQSRPHLVCRLLLEKKKNI